MTATVFTPDGIVISTIDSDNFYLSSRRNDSDNIELVNIVGHPHVVTFWNKYAMVFHQAGEFSYDQGLYYMLSEVMLRWEDSVPTIYDLMPYIKKQIVDNDLEIIGIMGGYSRSKDGKFEPYVYQVLGDDVRRINIDSEGKIAYNCVFLEKETSFGRLLRDVQVKNGDNWEHLPPINIRCDLFSVRKAIELNEFILTTAEYLKHINSSNYPKHRIENIVITPDKLTIV